MSKPFPVPDPRLSAPPAAVAPQPRGMHAALDQYTETTSKFLRNVGYPFDVVVIAPDRFEATKKIIGGIAYPAHQHGPVLYQAT